jgi:hypothetical protein
MSFSFQRLRGFLAKFTKTKEGYVLFGLGGGAVQTEQHSSTFFSSDLPREPLRSWCLLRPVSECPVFALN